MARSPTTTELLPPVASDPDFRPAVPRNALGTRAFPGAYRRILANPFLGFLGVGLWIAALYVLVPRAQADPTGTYLVLVMILFGTLWLLPRLFQYHCLDCGKTGPLLRWQRHLCPIVVRRIVTNQPRSWRGPTPGFQVLLWLVVLGVAVGAYQAILG